MGHQPTCFCHFGHGAATMALLQEREKTPPEKQICRGHPVVWLSYSIDINWRDKTGFSMMASRTSAFEDLGD